MRRRRSSIGEIISDLARLPEGAPAQVPHASDPGEARRIRSAFELAEAFGTVRRDHFDSWRGRWVYRRR